MNITCKKKKKAAFYFQNFTTFFPPKEEDGVDVFTVPNTSNITGYDVRDTGGVSAALFKTPSRYNGLLIPCAGEHFSPQEFVDKYAKHTGRKAKLNAVDFKTFAGFGFPGAEELADMFEFFHLYTYYGHEEKRELGVRLFPEMKELDQWLETKPFQK